MATDDDDGGDDDEDGRPGVTCYTSKSQQNKARQSKAQQSKAKQGTAKQGKANVFESVGSNVQLPFRRLTLTQTSRHLKL